MTAIMSTRSTPQIWYPNWKNYGRTFPNWRHSQVSWSSWPRRSRKTKNRPRKYPRLATRCFKMTPNQIKRIIASVLDMAGINSLGHVIQRALLSPFIRAVNYHIVGETDVENFEQHLKFYSSRFVNVN